MRKRKKRKTLIWMMTTWTLFNNMDIREKAAMLDVRHNNKICIRGHRSVLLSLALLVEDRTAGQATNKNYSTNKIKIKRNTKYKYDTRYIISYSYHAYI